MNSVNPGDSLALTDEGGAHDRCGDAMQRSERIGVGRLLAALGLASVSLSGCWLQVGFDPGHTRYNTIEAKLTAANAGSLSPAWAVGQPVAVDRNRASAGGSAASVTMAVRRVGTGRP